MKITLGKILSYVVGIPLVLLSILLLVETPLGLVPLLAGLLIIPVIRRQLASRVGIELSRGAAAGIGSVGVVAGVVLLILVALSSAGAVAPGDDVTNTTISAADSSPSDAATSLDVRWNARAQSGVDPDGSDLSSYSANDGQKFLVVRVAITNTGDEALDLTPQLFKLESDGVVYDYQALFGSGNSLSGVSVNPDASHSAWTAFSVPEGATEGTLEVNQEAYYNKNVTVSFEHDESMDINMSA